MSSHTASERAAKSIAMLQSELKQAVAAGQLELFADVSAVRFDCARWLTDVVEFGCENLAFLLGSVEQLTRKFLAAG